MKLWRPCSHEILREQKKMISQARWAFSQICANIFCAHTRTQENYFYSLKMLLHLFFLTETKNYALNSTTLLLIISQTVPACVILILEEYAASPCIPKNLFSSNSSIWFSFILSARSDENILNPFKCWRVTYHGLRTHQLGGKKNNRTQFIVECFRDLSHVVWLPEYSCSQSERDPFYTKLPGIFVVSSLERFLLKTICIPENPFASSILLGKLTAARRTASPLFFGATCKSLKTTPSICLFFCFVIYLS